MPTDGRSFRSSAGLSENTSRVLLLLFVTEFSQQCQNSAQHASGETESAEVNGDGGPRPPNWTEERCGHPERFTGPKGAGVRKWSFILLSGEAGASVSIFGGVFMILDTYKLSQLIGFAKASVRFPDSADGVLSSEGSPGPVSSCSPTTRAASCRLDTPGRGHACQHVPVS